MANEQSQNLNQKLAKFCANMNAIENMSSQFSDFYFELMDQPDHKDLVWNKLDANITFSFLNASFYWLYLQLKGVDLQDHPIKEEIGRVRKYMQEYVVMKKDAPKLNITAARNFIRNALWDPTRKTPEPSAITTEAKRKEVEKNYNKGFYNNKKKRI